MPNLKGKNHFLMMIIGKDCIKYRVSGRFKRPDHQGVTEVKKKGKKIKINPTRRVNGNGPRLNEKKGTRN